MEVMSSPFGVGFMEMLTVLMMNGAMSFPMGVPPAEEEALMSLVAPQECIFYTTWSGVALPNTGSENYTERLVGDKEIRQTLVKVESLLNDFARDLSRQQQRHAPELSKLTELIPEMGLHLLTNSGAVYLESVDPNPDSVAVQGAIVLQLGDKTLEIKDLLKKLQVDSLGDKVSKVTIGDREFFRFQVVPRAPPVTWGTRGTFLIVGFGEKSIERLFANVGRNSSDGLPTWLTGVRQQLAVDRVSTVSYINIKKIVDIAAPMLGDAEVRKMVDQLGLGNVTHFSTVTGLDKSGFVNRSLLGIEGEFGGVMKLLESQPLTADDFKSIPLDATLAAVARWDLGKTLDTALELVKQFSPSVAVLVDEGIRSVGAGIGIDVRKDVIGSLGDVWRIYTSPTDGGLLTGWTVSIDVRDRMTLAKSHESLIRLARAASDENEFAPDIGQFQFSEQDVFYLKFAVPVPFAPSWCISDGEIVIGLFPQSIKAHLSRGSDSKSLADHPAVSRVLAHGDKPTALSFYDTKQFFQLIYPFVQMMAEFGFSEAQREGLDLDVSLLPSGAAFAKHLQPTVAVVRRTKYGLESASYQTLPTGNIASSGPVMAALLLPAVQAARQAARRTQSINTLKQIGLALHNANDTYRALPAAYNTDKEGKPLLSWRVRILPYIEQQVLYDQFHLNEPWDSEHNLKLLDKMPPMFRSPNSKAGPNMTTMHAIGGEGGCFRPPDKDAAFYDRVGRFAGTTFGQITDGLSVTIWVVEAGDETAVAWTKPVEFVPDKDDLTKGLFGMYPGGFNALLGDGSVHFFTETIEPDLLRRLFNRKDGERVTMPR